MPELPKKIDNDVEGESYDFPFILFFRTIECVATGGAADTSGTAPCTPAARCIPGAKYTVDARFAGGRVPDPGEYLSVVLICNNTKVVACETGPGRPGNEPLCPQSANAID